MRHSVFSDISDYINIYIKGQFSIQDWDLVPDSGDRLKGPTQSPGEIKESQWISDDSQKPHIGLRNN